MDPLDLYPSSAAALSSLQASFKEFMYTSKAFVLWDSQAFVSWGEKQSDLETEKRYNMALLAAVKRQTNLWRLVVT